MQNKIIVTVYFKFKTAILAISNQLYKFKYILIIILSTICFVILRIYISPNIYFYTKLAFNTNTVHYEKLKQIYKSKIKVKLEGYNNLLLSTILPRHYTILQPYYHIKITKLVEYLQTSGFLNKIEYFIIYTNNIIYLILNININPIIKKIEIKKWNQLQIPQKLLINLFKNQIGLPANYRNIKKSIQKIYEWYQERGFEWTYIKLIKHKNSNIIKINIFEGKIKTNKFICHSKNKLNSEIIQKIETIITQKLQILPGSLLNIITIKENIKHLKKIKLIKNFKYYINYEPEGLIVQIEYSIFIDNQGCFYNKHLILNAYENKIRSYKSSQNNMHHNILGLLHTINQYIKMLKSSDLSFMKNCTLIISHIKNNLDYTFSYQYLGFKVFSPYLNLKYLNFIVHIVFTNKIPQINMIFSSPNVGLFQGLFQHLILNIYHKVHIIKTLYPIYNVRLRYFNIKNQMKLINLVNSIKTTISYKHHINNYFCIKKNIIDVHNIFTKKFINLKNYSNNQKSIVKILNTIIQQHLLYLKVEIKYKDIDFNNIFKSGKLLIIESLFFTFTKLTQINNVHNWSTLKYRILIKYNQNFTIPKLLPYIKKNILSVFSEISLPHREYQIIFHSYNIDTINMYLEFNKRTIITSYIKYLHHIEYHIEVYNFLSYYLFYHLSSQLHYMYTYYYQTQNIGLGIQLKIPINTIPPIRFEYGMNRYQHNYYQLRVCS